MLSTKVFVASLIALLLCLHLAPTRATSQKLVDDRLTAATSRFSFKLYDQILKQQRGEQNTFVSPASVMLALAMTYNGANGTTREAMARALEIEGMSLNDVNRAFAGLKSAVTPNDRKIQLKIANSLWARNGIKLNPAFVERNKQHYAAELATLNFSDPTAKDTINLWVSKNTEGKIQKIVDQIQPNDILFLINAIYFKGEWQTAFKKQDTKPDVFKLTGGERKEVSMMSQSGQYLYYKDRSFQAVALPYGEGTMSMLVFLPDEQTGLAQFEQDLTAQNWELWMNSFRGTPGTVKLPRFKVEWQSKLNEVLKALGMAEAFDEARADFSQMADVSGNRIFISDVRQKSWCEVNEEGTVAAAATSVTATLTSLPPEPFTMKVDRPFFFAIRDNRTGVVLFMGSVQNPG
jgi:serpin B